MKEIWLTLLGAAIAGFAWLGKEVVSWYKRRGELYPRYPRRTIVITLQPGSYLGWRFLRSEELTKQVDIQIPFLFTNITDRPLRLVAGELEQPKALARVRVGKSDDEPIKEGVHTGGSVSFSLKDTKLKAGDTIKTRLTIIDQFNNRHQQKIIIPYKPPKAHLSKIVEFTPFEGSNLWRTQWAWSGGHVIVEGMAQVKWVATQTFDHVLIVGVRLSNDDRIGEVKIEDPVTGELALDGVQKDTGALRVRFTVVTKGVHVTKGSPFTTTVIFLDQYGNEYALPQTTFDHDPRKTVG